MALELTVNSMEEFQDIVDSKDFRISESVVTSILNNLNTKKQNVHIISVTILEEGSTLDMTLERKFFAETLEENLKYFIDEFVRVYFLETILVIIGLILAPFLNVLFVSKKYIDLNVTVFNFTINIMTALFVITVILAVLILNRVFLQPRREAKATEENNKNKQNIARALTEQRNKFLKR